MNNSDNTSLNENVSASSFAQSLIWSPKAKHKCGKSEMKEFFRTVWSPLPAFWSLEGCHGLRFAPDLWARASLCWLPPQTSVSLAVNHKRPWLFSPSSWPDVPLRVPSNDSSVWGVVGYGLLTSAPRWQWVSPQQPFVFPSWHLPHGSLCHSASPLTLN